MPIGAANRGTFLERAAQQMVLVAADAVLDDISLPIDKPHLTSSLISAFVMAGDVDQGILLARNMGDSVELLPEKLSALLHIVQLMSLSRDSQIQVDNQSKILELLTEAEQIARLTENAEPQLLRVAFSYVAVESIESSRRLAAEALSTFDLNDYDTRSDLIELLFIVGDDEAGLALLDGLDNQPLLADLVIQLVYEEQEEIAWQLFEQVTSFMQKVEVLIAIADAYQYALDRPDEAFLIMKQALEIIQSNAFSNDASFGEIIDYYEQIGEPYSPEEIVSRQRESLIVEIIEMLESDESVRSLLPLIEDNLLRDNLALAFLPESSAPDEPLSTSASSVTDADWQHVASEAASEGSFLQAVEVISMMASPDAQTSALINIAQCYADSATDLDAETRRLLEEIQQRYE